MGRKSLANKRIEQILDAFERCIVKHGLENSTLEKIAAEAKVKRSILHHYIGNWDDLLKALVSRAIMQERKAMEGLIQISPKDELLSNLMETLFPESISEEDVIIDTLITTLWTRHERDPYTKGLLDELYHSLEKNLQQVLEHLYPTSIPKTRQQVAYALLCLSEGYYTTSILSTTTERSVAARKVAKDLLTLYFKPKEIYYESKSS